MPIYYLIITLLLIIILVQKWYIIVKQKIDFLPYINYALIGCVVSIIVTSVFLIVKNKFIATIFYNLNFLCLDVIVYSLFLFQWDYNNTKQNKVILRILFLFFITADSIFLLLNCFEEIYFSIEYMQWKNTPIYYWSLKILPLMLFHYVLCFIIVILSLLPVIKKAFTVPSIYKPKYVGFLIFYFPVVAISYISNILDLFQDFSIYFYILMAEVAFRYSLVTVDQKIKQKTNQNIIQNYSIAVCWFNRENQLIYQNNKANEFFDFFNMKKNDIEKFYKDFIKKNYARNLNIAVNDEVFTKNNEEYYYTVTYKKIFKDKYLIGAYLHFKDITFEKRKKMEETLASNKDTLTGINNRQNFFELCDTVLQEKNEKTWLMICSNIKDFKIINNLFGKDVGDQILIAQAEIIKKYAHPSTVYGRIVDDKFAILMEKELYNEEFFARRIIDVAKITKNNYYHMSQQIGVYESGDVKESAQYMYDKAIMAIENSSTISNKNIYYYNDSIMKKFLQDKSIISDFEFAFNSSQFIIYLQPIFNDGDKVIGSQALVRWNKPEVGIIKPDKFIPLFEKTEIIHKLDKFVWEKAIQQLCRWEQIVDTKLFISISISTTDFYYIDIIETFKSFMKEYHFNPKQLKLSFNEDALLKVPEKVLNIISELHQMGFEIEINGFGNNYFSINMLNEINVEYIRIDMNRIGDFESKNQIAVLESILKLANDLNIRIIGDSIENEQQREFLKKKNCKILQGYYLGEPVSRFEFEEKYL